MSRPRRRPRPSAVATACLLLAACALPLPAQDFGEMLKRTVKRASQSEVQRKVDQETRELTRCAMGDERCVREAQRRGEQVETASGGGDGAAGAAGGDHPLIVPYRGSVREDRDFKSYTDYRRIVGLRDGQVQVETLEGRLTFLRYRNPAGRSTFEILRNYRDALAAKGMRVDWECASRQACGSTARWGSGRGWKDVNGLNPGIAGDVRYFTGRLRHGGGDAVVSIAVNPQVTDLHVLETAAMDTGMVAVNADALAAGLAQDGKVTLEGLYFDSGRATLQAASNPALEQAALLMKQQPALKLLVVGHTDSTGSAAANLKLSQQRAEAVRAALVARGIAASRLSAQGVGSSAPVASNDSEAGRAQNRRVELVKQ